MRTQNSSSTSNLDGNHETAETALHSFSEDAHRAGKPELDADEGADILETLADAVEAQRENEPERRDEEIISLDPSD